MLEPATSAASMTVLRVNQRGASQQQTMDQEKTGEDGSPNPRIKFSVAALLADTRPRRSPEPEEDELSGLEEDVDVEEAESPNASFLQHPGNLMAARLMLSSSPSVTPIRPTPTTFSALAAAAYTAALQPHHPSWSHYPGPPVFPSFGSSLSGSPGNNQTNYIIFMYATIVLGYTKK